VENSKELGHEVVIAQNGKKAAITRLQACAYHHGCQMPEMDGFRRRRIKSDPEISHIPILILHLSG
jgi:CheY-like chemotaxis protein